jgi:replicative DNA helicase
MDMIKNELMKELPNDCKAEQSVLGAILVDHRVLKQISLQPEDFYREEHKIIYEQILDLYRQGIVPDIVTVMDKLKVIGKLDFVGGESYLMQITASVPNVVNVIYYENIVKRDSIARQIWNKAQEISSLALSLDIEGTKLKASDILNLNVKEDDKAFSELFTEEYFEKLTKTKRWESDRLKDLTRYVPFQRGENIYIAGRTSIGKTQFALDLAWQFAEQGAKVGYVSLEIAEEAILPRMIIYEVGDEKIDLKLRDIDIRQPEWQQIGKAILRNSNVYKNFHFTRERHFLNDIVEWIENRPFDVVFVDYIQSLDVRGKSTRYEEMNIAAREFRRLSKDRCMVILSQFNRDKGYKNDDDEEEITISRLRDSGVLEETATSIILLRGKGEQSNTFYYTVAKNQTFGTTTAGWIELKRTNSGKFYEV